MVKAENGQILTEEEAKLLTDNTGKQLEWKENKDTPGIMTAEGTEGPGATYNYTIEKIQPIKVRVTVNKQRKDVKQIIELKNKLNKTEIDADDIEVQNEYKSRGAQSFNRDLANAPVPEKDVKKSSSSKEEEGSTSSKKSKY